MSVGDNSNPNSGQPNFQNGPANRSNSGNQNGNRSRGNNQGDRAHNNSRRSSNYNNNRNNNSRNRHPNDQNVSQNSGGSHNNRDASLPNNTPRNPNYNSRNTGNRFEQGNTYGQINRNYESRNPPPQLTQSLLNSMDEFPSLDGTTPIVVPQNPAEPSFTTATPQTPQDQPIVSQNAFENATGAQTHPTLFSQHQTTNTNPRQYNNNHNKRGGNKNNGQRDHQQNSGRNNYNRQSGASQIQNQNNQQNNNSRSRNNRRGGNHVSNYDHNRRVNNRDYNQLPNMMNGVRIGMNPIQFPYMGVGGPPVYPPPMINPVSGGMPQPIPPPPPPMLNPVLNPVLGKEQNSRPNAPKKSRPPVYLPGESPQDIAEAERYKSLTTNPALSRSEHIKYQIEYYFCNNNLRNDAFLRGQMDGEGYVNAYVIVKFNRVAKFDVVIEEIVPIISTSTKLEYKIRDNGNLYIRRLNDADQWTQTGIEKEQNRLFELYPELATEQAIAQVIPPIPQNQMNGVPQMHAIPFSVPLRNFSSHGLPPPSYLSNYIHPSQMAMNYGIYQMDDMNSQYGVVFDPNMTNQGVDMSQNMYHDINQIEQELQNQSFIENKEQTYNQNTIKDHMIDNQEIASSDFQLTEIEYQNLLTEFLNNRKSNKLSKNEFGNVANKIYRYWTHNLVLIFEIQKYDMFRKCAIEDAAQQQRDGITMLFQFYERFLHRYPFSQVSSGLADGTQHDYSKDISKKIFDQFQQDAYDDYLNNECVGSLTKLLRFTSQFSNPSRQSPPLKPHIQQVINQLGLSDSSNNSDSNKKRPNTDDKNVDRSSAIHPTQGSHSTHH